MSKDASNGANAATNKSNNHHPIPSTIGNTTSNSSSSSSSSPLFVAFQEKRVSATTTDLDHYRIHGGMAVETDFIISVTSKGRGTTGTATGTGGQQSPNPTLTTTMPDFEPFKLSKTYSAFRSFAHQLKKAADLVTTEEHQQQHYYDNNNNNNNNDVVEGLPKPVQKLAQYCEAVLQLVESQRTQYIGKVNFNYVKALAKKRVHIVNQVLEMTLAHFPTTTMTLTDPFSREVATMIETFFLLDHCLEVDNNNIDDDDDSNNNNDAAAANVSGHRRLGSFPFKPLKVKRKSAESTTTKESDSATTTTTTETKDPFKAVQNAVGGAMDNVGNFLKEKGLHHLTPQRNKVTTNDMTISTNTNPPISELTSIPLKSPVVPYTRKSRRSTAARNIDEHELDEIGSEANLLVDDDRSPTELVPSYAHPLPTFGSPGTKLGDLLETNPLVFLGIFIMAAKFLSYVAHFEITVDLDVLLLFIWASFCIGLHTPRPMVGGIDKSTTPPNLVTSLNTKNTTSGTPRIRKQDHHGRQLLRMSMMASPDAASAAAANGEGFRENYDKDSPRRTPRNMEEDTGDEEDSIMDVGQSPLPVFPKGAPLGSKLNCWSEPVFETFQVRGTNYLKDKIKEASGPFVFPIRATDLFLTDLCPENAGSNPGILGGHLREKPTFIINFRLPWGIFLAYFEIPERFIPFIRAAHEDGFDASSLPSLDDMSASDRCISRFCQDPVSEKNKKLKIVPVVVEGPWVVRSVVGGKPAIIGNKMPVNYHYAPADGDKAMYLEADLDIVSSSAARGILSVARTYTQVLTIDLGFVVQANQQDELPEQMLIGSRLHGIDPLTAPPYPLCGQSLMHNISNHSEDSDED